MFLLYSCNNDIDINKKINNNNNNENNIENKKESFIIDIKNNDYDRNKYFVITYYIYDENIQEYSIYKRIGILKKSLIKTLDGNFNYKPNYKKYIKIDINDNKRYIYIFKGWFLKKELIDENKENSLFRFNNRTSPTIINEDINIYSKFIKTDLYSYKLKGIKPELLENEKDTEETISNKQWNIIKSYKYKNNNKVNIYLKDKLILFLENDNGKVYLDNIKLDKIISFNITIKQEFFSLNINDYEDINLIIKLDNKYFYNKSIKNKIIKSSLLINITEEDLDNDFIFNNIRNYFKEISIEISGTLKNEKDKTDNLEKYIKNNLDFEIDIEYIEKDLKEIFIPDNDLKLNIKENVIFNLSNLSQINKSIKNKIQDLKQFFNSKN